MSVNQMNEPNNVGEDQGEFPDPWGVLMLWGEEEAFVYHSSSSSSSSSSPSPSPSPSPSAMLPHSPVVVAVAESVPHSSLGACHSAPAMEDIPWRQSDNDVSSSQDEKPSASEVPEDQGEFPDPWGVLMLWGEEEAFVYHSSSSSSSSSSSPSPSPSPSAMLPHSPVVVAVAESVPHSSLGACHSAPAMEDISWSQSDDDVSSSQDEKPSASEVPEGASYSPRSPQPFSMNNLLAYLLLKFREMEPTTQAEMLNIIQGHEDRFPELLRQASLWLQLLLGIDVKTLDASDYCYVMVPTLGLTYDGMGSDRCSVPKTALLVMVLCTIVVEEDCASEEAVWKALNDMGLQEGVQHCIYGDLRELLTNFWVQEQYVEYRQVANSDPARYEFLWGPRAHAETTREQAFEFFHRHSSTDMSSYPSLSEVVETSEEHRA